MDSIAIKQKNSHPTPISESTPKFGCVEFTPEEKRKVQQLLQERVGAEFVSFRPGSNESNRSLF
jgi:recombination DNA repair RAD52 pathway protein